MKMGNGKYFVNFTNHPSKHWFVEQIKSAEVYGEIIDMPFPQINPHLTSAEIKTLAKKYVEEIMNYSPGAVLCQGEFTLCFAVVEILKTMGIPVLAACTKRIVEEDGNSKIVRFKFECFREY